MKTPSEQPFEVIEFPGGRKYRLPVRDIGHVRYLAFLPLGLVLVGTHFCYDLSRMVLANQQVIVGVWMWLWIAVTLLVWAWGCYFFVSAAAAIWCGRTEIEVRDDGSLRSCDRVGWLRYLWVKLPPNSVRKLVVSDSSQVPNAENRLPLKQGAFWQLSAELQQGKPLTGIAHYHTRPVLEALAPLLSQQLALTATTEADAVPVQVVEQRSRDVLEQPATSKVVCEQHADGVTLTVPPAGVLLPHGGMFIIGCVFEALGFGLLVFVIVSQFQGNPLPLPLIGPAIVGMVSGVAMVLAAIQAGRKRLIFAVVGEQLLLLEAGPLRSKRREWLRSDISDIHCTTNIFTRASRGKPFLGIVLQDKTTIELLVDRDELELQWIATMLRNALRL